MGRGGITGQAGSFILKVPAWATREHKETSIRKEYDLRQVLGFLGTTLNRKVLRVQKNERGR